MSPLRQHWFLQASVLGAYAMASLWMSPNARAQDVQTCINDMTLPPDAALHGVPSRYSWASGIAQTQPIPVPAKNWKKEWFQAMTAWGQVYIPAQGSTATNTRCQIRNLTTKYLLKSGQWVTLQSSKAPEGAAFREDFANNESMDAGARSESVNGGGSSFIVGVGPWANHNYHFWPAGGRANVDVNTIVGIYTSCEARLILDNPSGPDDRAQCKNVLQMGGDWWLSKSAGWLPDWSANSGIGSTRAKWVTANWQTFNFCTLEPARIRANPPFGGAATLPVSRPNPTATAPVTHPINR